MIKSYFLLLLISFCLSPLLASSNTLETLKTRGELDNNFKSQVMFDSLSVDGNRMRARTTGVGAQFKLDYKLDSNFFFIANLGFRIQTGSNNSLNVEEFAPEREWLLHEATLNWKAIQSNQYNINSKVSLGAIDQSWIETPQLVAQMAFMGAFQQLDIRPHRRFTISLLAQQSIPNNQTLSLRAGGIDEGTPQFFIQGAQLAYQSQSFKARLRSLYFVFDGLAGDVADKSRFMGNDVTGSSTQSEFLYDFQGWTSKLNFSFYDFFNMSQIDIFTDYLFNSRAPDNSNSGHRVGLEISPNSKFSFNTFYFEQENNTAVGFYNEKSLGHNNKKGLSFEIKVTELFESTQLRLNYTNSKVLNQQSHLDGDMDLVSFELIYDL